MNPDRVAQIWDVRSGKALAALTVASGTAVINVAFAPDGKTLASGSADTTVLLWDLTDPTKPK